MARAWFPGGVERGPEVLSPQGRGPTAEARVAPGSQAAPPARPCPSYPERERKSWRWRESVNVSRGGRESFNGVRDGGDGEEAGGDTSAGPPAPHSLHRRRGRVRGAWGLGGQTSRRWGGAKDGPPERQLRPDGQVAVFTASGKQMTERKPSAGMGNAARAGWAQIWVRTGGKPLPRARGLPPPRMRQPRGFRGAGEGAAAGRAPRRETKLPPTGAGGALGYLQRTCKYM